MRLLRRFVPAALLGCTLWFATSPAWADAAAQARFHDRMARKHYERGRFRDAVREFFQSNQLAPNPRTAFNIALCFQQLDRPVDAFMMFSEYLASGEDEPERRKMAEEAIAALTPKVARIEVTSEPAGTRIFVNRRELGDYGTTPRVIAMQEGEHKVWVELDGYRLQEATVTAKLGELVQVDLRPERILGRLVIESSAEGQAVVRTPRGELISRGPTPHTASVPPGPYEVSVSAPGYQPWRGLTGVRADESVRIEAAPEAIPDPTGEMTVTSNVPGVMVRLDGQPTAFTPSVLTRLPVGSHDVELASPGRLPWSGKVDVEADKRTWLTVNLEEPPTTQRSAVTWVVGGIGATALAGAGVVGLMAASNHQDFEDAANDPSRGDIRSRGQDLNTAGDVLLAVGLAGLSAGAILYFTTETQVGKPSAASVSSGAR